MLWTEAFLEHGQTLRWSFFAKIVKLLTIFAKNLNRRMFDWVLNTPLIKVSKKSLWYFFKHFKGMCKKNQNLVYYHMSTGDKLVTEFHRQVPMILRHVLKHDDVWSRNVLHFQLFFVFVLVSYIFLSLFLFILFFFPSIERLKCSYYRH